MRYRDFPPFHTTSLEAFVRGYKVDRHEQPEYIRKAFRRFLLEGDEAMLAANRALHEFSNLRRYVLSVERLIDEQEQFEVDGLKPYANKLSEEEDKAEFWAWHHPVHWDEIVRTLFRASTLMAMASFLETTLNQVCRDVRLVTEEALSPNELHGGIIKRSKRYLIRFGGFTAPKDELWRQVVDLIEIRNVFVHANGKIEASNNPEKIRGAMARSPGLREEPQTANILIEKEYLSHALDSIENFLSYLLSEMHGLCIRRKRFEVIERSST